MTTYVGIDPGQTGGLARVLHNGDLDDVVPMPSVSGEVSGWQIGEIIQSWRSDSPDRVVVVIEEVHAMPKQGVSSTFKFGKSYGIAIGAAQALGAPIHFVRPQEWKKTFTLVGKHKDASRSKATELWPRKSEHWTRKMDNGLTDAALIAEHARRNKL